MKQTLKLWIIVGILTICGTMSFASCTANDDRSALPLDSSKNPSEERPTIERIVKRGKLLVGTTGDYRPLSYQEADCSYWGFGIEMAGKIAERLGVNIEFVQTSWPTLTADVLAEP